MNRTGSARGPSWSGRPGRSRGSCNTLEPLRPLKPLYASDARWSLRSLGSHGAHRSTRPLRPHGSARPSGSFTPAAAKDGGGRLAAIRSGPAGAAQVGRRGGIAVHDFVYLVRIMMIHNALSLQICFWLKPYNVRPDIRYEKRTSLVSGKSAACIPAAVRCFEREGQDA